MDFQEIKVLGIIWSALQVLKSKKCILSFFKFLQKEKSRLGKINLLYSLNESRGFATWFLQVTIPKNIQKCAGIFLSSRETFLWKFERWKNVIFGPMNCWDSLPSGYLGPLLLKSCSLWSWFYSKNFSRAKLYVFWGTYLVFELFARENFLKKKHRVPCTT